MNNSYAIISLLLLISLSSIGQVYNDGSALTIDAGISVYLDDMSFVNQTNGSDGSLDNEGDVYVERDWLNNASGGVVSTDLNATGTIHIQGNVAQTIGGSRTTTFENLSINNSTAIPSGVSLTRPITINNALTMTDGVVFSDATNLFTVIDDATSTVGNSGSYVDGPMTKIGDDDFTFPLGDGAIWARLGIDNSDGTATTAYTAEYKYTRHSKFMPTHDSLERASFMEHWLVEQSVNADSALVTLYYEDNNNKSKMAELATIVVAQLNAGLWYNMGAGMPISLTSPDGFLTASTKLGALSSTAFTFGTSSTLFNPLPLTLLMMEATRVGEDVFVLWYTATEQRLDRFEIERSADGEQFERIGVVNAIGESFDVQEYRFVDENPFQGDVYYRLKQIDEDGTFSYSKIVVLDGIGLLNHDLVLIPNPTDGREIFVVLDNKKEIDLAKVNVYSADGRLIPVEVSKASHNNKMARLALPEDLAAGNYFITVNTPKGTVTRKLVLQ